ncbi:unnamed protein product [Rotaria sordida]|uniref:Right handed beta helix domain-containing protein n=1 Tax=Rotaria sordida TaxID=392033 RepID=A0A815PD72_9BILA|nr:unnamed protein product [Rotaria sordida]CAF4059763.1 unnamed protein product [Rotaria sordida]
MWQNIIFLVYLYFCKTIVYSKIITPDDPSTLQSAIISANQEEGLGSVTLAPGIYRIPFNSHPNANILLTNLRNFVINANNVTFLMLDNRKRGIVFYNCYNVTMRGVMTIRNDIIPFSQGYIESIDQKSFVINIHDGYQTTLDNTIYFPKASTYYIFDRNTRRLKDQTYDYYNRDISRIDQRRFRVMFDNNLGQGIVIGDLVSMRGSGDFGIICDICELMQFIDVNIEFAGGFAWFETGGKGNNRYERISAQPGPKPLGATEEPLMSANADGFHSAGVSHGPTIINSFFTRMPDDGIAIHGEYQMIRQINQNVIICMRRWASIPYAIGDRAAIVGKDGIPRGEARVQQLRALPDDYLSSIDSPWPHFQNNHYYFELELDTNLNGTISSNDFISNIESTGSGYVLKENVILNHRARGMLLKAHDGLIESNLINGSSISGLVMQPEFWWGEGNYAERVIIRNNTLIRCGYATTGSWTQQAGVLTIYGTGTSSVAYGHHAITIENNFFIDNDGAQMVLDGLKNVLIKRNYFTNAQHKVNNRGSDHGIDGGALVHINRAQSLALEGNRAWCLGAAHSKPLQVTYLSTQIIGMLDGIIVDNHC